MQINRLQWFWRPLLNQHGFGGIGVAVAISLVSLIASAAYYNCPQDVDSYADALSHLHDGTPTNEDIDALRVTLDSCAKAAGGLPLPGSAEDVLLIALNQLQGAAVDIGMTDINDLVILDSSTGACSLTHDKNDVKRGEGVMVSISIPRIFHNQVGGISCLVGEDNYREIAIPEGDMSISVPSQWYNYTMPVSCNVTAKINPLLTICAPHTTINVNNPLVDPCPGPDTIHINGLEWDRCGPSKRLARSWEQAIDVCDELVLAGHSDWRLPTKDEVKSIVVCSNEKPTPLADHDWCSSNGVDRDFSTPTYDTSIFSPRISMLWSSESYDADNAWIVYFQTGMAYGYRKIYIANIRCVR